MQQQDDSLSLIAALQTGSFEELRATALNIIQTVRADNQIAAMDPGANAQDILERFGPVIAALTTAELTQRLLHNQVLQVRQGGNFRAQVGR